MTTPENPGLRSVFEAARKAVGLREGCAYADVVSGIKYLKVSSDGRSAAVIRAELAEEQLEKAKAEAEALREHYTTLVHRHYHAKREAEERLKSAVDEYEKDLAAAEAALQKIEKEAELRSERHIAAIARRALQPEEEA